MFTKYIIVAATAIMAVSAQSSGSAAGTGSAAPPSTSAIPGLTPCVLACVTPAAELNGCNSFTNVTCVCSSAQFQADALACLEEHCTPADLQAAQTLQNEECEVAGVSATASATTTDSLSFTLASSAGASSAAGASSVAAPSGSGSAGAASPTVTTPTVSTPAVSGAGGSTTGAAPSTTTTPASSAAGLIANSGAGAIIAAIMAGVLAL